MVVTHEQLLISRVVAGGTGHMELILRADDLVSILLSQIPLCCTGIHLSIQVETSQQHLCSHFVHAVVAYAAIGQRTIDSVPIEVSHLGLLESSKLFCRQCTFQVFELSLEPVIELLAGELWLGSLANLQCERHGSEEVEQIVVVEGANEAYLSDLCCAFALCRSMLEEVVAKRYIKIETIVDTGYQRVDCGPRDNTQIRHSGITVPDPPTFVGRELVELENHTYESRYTFVYTLDVTIAGRACLAGGSQRGVDFGKYSVLIEVLDVIRVLRSDVQILHTGSEEEGSKTK